MGRWQQRLPLTVVVDGGQWSSSGWRWQVGAGSEPAIGSGRRRQVAVAQHLPPHSLPPLPSSTVAVTALDNNVMTGAAVSGRGRQRQQRRRWGGRQPAHHHCNKYLPSPRHPSTISISSFSLGLSTADVGTAMMIVGD
jgi:hypothetical protein